MNNTLDLNSSPNKQTPEEDDLFYFESDHLALKGNKDYSEILKTIFILEAQRERAVKDFEKVVEIQKEALNDPLSFIEKVKRKEDVGIPPYQRIAEVPSIDWNKFNVKIPEGALKSLSDKEDDKIKAKLVENLYKNKKASDTHKKKWTAEEQKRLEELLEVYPPERVELRRFKKIASALGNRTVKQVTSRVQKYFLRLYKAGLPIPGRIPKSAEKYKRSKLHMHQRHNHYLWKPSTFFPHLDIPVKMNDFEEVPGPSINQQADSALSFSSSNYLLPKPEEYKTENIQEYKTENTHLEIKDSREAQLELLKRVKEVKRKEMNMNLPVSHTGFKCDFCDEEPIIGARWHCITCITNSVDYCTDCVVQQMYSNISHPSSHRLEPDFGEFLNSNNPSELASNGLYETSKSYGTSESDSSDSETSSELDSDSASAQDSCMNSKDGLFNNSEEQMSQFCETDLTGKTIIENFKGPLLNSGSIEYYNTENNDTSDSQTFTDTQSVSYRYLHSNLVFGDKN